MNDYLKQIEAAPGAPLVFGEDPTQYIRVPTAEGKDVLKGIRTEAELARARQEGTVKREYLSLPAEAKAQFITGMPFYPEVKAEEIPTVEDLDAGIAGTDFEPPATVTVADLEAYQKGVAQTVTDKKAELKIVYDTQIDKVALEQADLRTQIADIEKKIGEEGTVTEEIKALSEPFREQLRESERKRLEVEKNYFANQTTVDELNNMAIEAQQIIDSVAGRPASAMVNNKRIADAKESFNARAGILQAVISARDGQMSRARQMIQDSLTDINNDRTDQLNYYQDIWNFYDKQRDEAGNKLITLDAREQGFIQDQISIIEDDLKTARARENYLIDLMTDPNMAAKMERSGVTATDTPEEIQEKFAKDTYDQEQIDTRNKWEEEGYDYVGSSSKSLVDIYNERTDLQEAYPEAMTEGSDDQRKLNDWWNTTGKKEFPDTMLTGGIPEEELTRIKDSQGREMIFRVPEEKREIESVRALQLQFPTAGITTADTVDEAISKAMVVASEEQKLDLAQKRATLARTLQLAAEGEEVVAPTTVTSWVNAIRSGATTIGNVPADIRDAVVATLYAPSNWTDEEIRATARIAQAKDVSYQDALNEISVDPLILNKDRARFITGELYGEITGTFEEFMGVPVTPTTPKAGVPTGLPGLVWTDEGELVTPEELERRKKAKAEEELLGKGYFTGGTLPESTSELFK